MKALGRERIEQSFPVTWFHLESGQTAYCPNPMFLVVQNEFLVMCGRGGVGGTVVVMVVALHIKSKQKVNSKF